MAIEFLSIVIFTFALALFVLGAITWWMERSEKQALGVLMMVHRVGDRHCLRLSGEPLRYRGFWAVDYHGGFAPTDGDGDQVHHRRAAGLWPWRGARSCGFQGGWSSRHDSSSGCWCLSRLCSWWR